MFPEVVLTGTPYEKGFILGSKCKEQVLHCLQTYQKRFMDAKKMDWAHARNFAMKYEPLLAGKYQKYKEEMQGIADGAGVDFQDILALNVRTEILYSGITSMCPDTDECTAFSLVDPATENGVTLAGQTWDFTRAQRGSAVIARIPAEGNTPAMLLFLEAGIIGGKGVNSSGLCLTLNALSSPEGNMGIPLHVRMRSILECNDVNSAYIEAVAAPIAMPACLIITHRDGISLCLELDPSGVDVIAPDHGVIVHTNHFYGPRMVLNHSHSERGSTYIRLQRMRQLINCKGVVTQTDMENFMKDHAGYPCSICTHPSMELSYEKRDMAGSTNYAFVVDLTNGIMRFVAGNPCEGEFSTLEFPKAD